MSWKSQSEVMVERTNPEETNPLKKNQLCIATEQFGGQQEGDLAFNVGEKIRIISPCELMFWYQAQNEEGKVGMVPSNFLTAIDDKENELTSGCPMVSTDSDADYLHMNPRELEQAKKDDMAIRRVQEREEHRRLQAGTLVIGTSAFVGQEKADLSFEVAEEMMILEPLPDLCWYRAQKTDCPSSKGTIPVTHIRLVYMSDDEDNNISTEANDNSQDRLYDDVNEFISQSGWYSFPSLPHSKEALHHVLARRCRMNYKVFMECKEAVYYFNYQNGEKKYIGKANVLHEELSGHFDHFEDRKDVIKEVDDELCHHTSLAGWELIVWPLQEGQDLDVECGKKIIELDALVSKDGNGITEQLSFNSKSSFDEFWDWFSPPT